MTEIELTEHELVLHIQGIDQILSFRKRIEAPLGHVVRADVGIEPEVRQALARSLRLPGAYVPGLVVAGSYLQVGERTWLFFTIHRGERAITIRLAHEHYEALVVEVENPEETVAAINAAVGETSPSP